MTFHFLTPDLKRGVLTVSLWYLSSRWDVVVLIKVNYFRLYLKVFWGKSFFCRGLLICFYLNKISRYLITCQIRFIAVFMNLVSNRHCLIINSVGLIAVGIHNSSRLDLGPTYSNILSTKSTSYAITCENARCVIVRIKTGTGIARGQVTICAGVR